MTEITLRSPLQPDRLLAPIQPERRSEMYWLISDSWIMAKRSTMHIIRSMDQVLSLILFPIMFMLLNRYVLGGAIDTGESVRNFLFPASDQSLRSAPTYRNHWRR